MLTQVSLSQVVVIGTVVLVVGFILVLVTPPCVEGHEQVVGGGQVGVVAKIIRSL